MQDIQPHDNKSIRNIPIPNKKRSSSVRAQGNDKRARRDGSGSGGHANRRVVRIGLPSWRIWAVAGVALVALVFAISVLFEHATVTITPKTQRVPIDMELTAVRDGSNSGDIAYDVVELSVTETQTLKATTTASEPSRARGTITVFNNHTSDPLTLIEQTRFEGPNGLIYRTPTAITIPGRVVEGGESIPGTLDVEVVATEDGSEYNTESAEFSVPGFKGDPAYERVYAQIKTSLSGGASANETVLSAGKRTSMERELKNIIERLLRERVADETPDGFVFLDPLYAITYEDEQRETDTQEVEFGFTGTIRAVIVNETELADLVLNTVAPQEVEGGIAEEAVEAPKYIANARELLAQYTGTGSIAPQEQSTIPFSLSGTALVVWKVDDARLSSELVRRSKDGFSRIMDRHENIVNAELVVRPVWKQSLPEKREDITIVNTVEDGEN